MITHVVLYGSLGKRFKKHWHLNVQKPGDVIDAISNRFPNFRRAILEMEDCDFGVTVGDDQIPGERLMFPNNGATITITPVIRGSDSSKSWIQIIAGVVLIAVGIFGQWIPVVGQAITMLGVSLVLGGVAQLLSPSPPTSGTDTETKTRPSYQFSTVVNSIGQGECVPVLYGGDEFLGIWVGSAVVSAAYESLDIRQGSNATPGSPTSQTTINEAGLPIESDESGD